MVNPSPLRSLSSWVCLLASLCLFALTVLAPKLMRHERLASLHASNARQMQDLQQQLDSLEQLAASIRRDPQLLARMTGVVPSNQEGLLDILVPEPHAAPTTPPGDTSHGLSASPLWPVIVRLTTVPLWQVTLLLLSAGLMILAFLIPAGVRQERGPRCRRSLGVTPLAWLLRRYRAS